jgi:replicative DNA helicase
MLNENAVAGSVIIDPSCLQAIASILTVNDFSFAQPQAIFQAATALSVSDSPIDVVTIKDKAKELGTTLSDEYLLGIMQTTPTAANAELYAQLVKTDSDKRALHRIATEIDVALKENESPDEIASKVHTALEAIDAKARRDMITSPEAIQGFYEYRAELEAQGKSAIVRTCYDQLDRTLGGGLVNGGLYVVGARPGVGKTSFAMCLADSIASSGMPTLFVSLEMTNIELTAKRLAREGGVNYSQVLMGKLGNEEYQKINKIAPQLSDNPVTITDKPRMTTNDIALAARRVKGVRCIIIDYFGLITPTSRSQSRYERMTDIIDDLKRLAKTLNLPIICLAQLNRENEQRGNKRPVLSDLRETGAVEQDADAVIFLHRESYYSKEETNEWDSESLEVIVAKNRHGRTGKIDMMWFGPTGRIYEQT